MLCGDDAEPTFPSAALLCAAATSDAKSELSTPDDGTSHLSSPMLSQINTPTLRGFLELHAPVLSSPFNF